MRRSQHTLLAHLFGPGTHVTTLAGAAAQGSRLTSAYAALHGTQLESLSFPSVWSELKETVNLCAPSVLWEASLFTIVISACMRLNAWSIVQVCTVLGQCVCVCMYVCVCG